MLCLRILLMTLSFICLMEGSINPGTTLRGQRPSENVPAKELKVMDRKKPKPSKKCKKFNKKKCLKKCKVCSKIKDCTKCCSKWCKVTKPTTPISTTPKTTPAKPTSPPIIVTTPVAPETTTPPTISPTTPTTPLPTSPTTPTTASPPETTTPPTTSPTTPTTALPATASPPGECKATNGKPCIFPFKDGNEEYNKCKNHGGVYYWCATSVYGSGKYKHWSYCPLKLNVSCPFPGGKCKTTKNLPCIFPFKDGEKEYNECPDDGKRFWCATSTNSAGQQNNWGECKIDGSCPIETTTPVMTPTATAATTTLLTTGTSTSPDEIENKVVSSLKDLVKEESKDGTLEMLETMNKITQTIIEDLKEQSEDNDPKNIVSNHNFEGGNPQSQELSLGYKQGVKSEETRKLVQNFEFVQNTVSWRGSISPVSDASGCCSECQRWSDAVLFDYSHYFGKCYCYKKLSTTEALIRENNRYSAGDCGTTTEDACCETLIISSSGGTSEHQGARLGTYKKDGEHNNNPVYKQHQGSKILFFSEHNGFEWVVGSSFSSGGGLRSKIGDAPVCPSDAKQWEYYLPGTTNTWIVDSTARVACEAGITECREATQKDCPTKHTFLEGGFTAIPFEGMLDSTHDVDTKCACRHLCDVRPTECKAFLFKTCSKGLEPRCILLNMDKPATTTTGLYKNHFAFCRRDLLVTKSRTFLEVRIGDGQSGTQTSFDLQMTLTRSLGGASTVLATIYFNIADEQLNGHNMYKGSDSNGNTFYLFVQQIKGQFHWVIANIVMEPPELINQQHILFININIPPTTAVDDQLPRLAWKENPRPGVLSNYDLAAINNWPTANALIVNGANENAVLGCASQQAPAVSTSRLVMTPNVIKTNEPNLFWIYDNMEKFADIVHRHLFGDNTIKKEYGYLTYHEGKTSQQNSVESAWLRDFNPDVFAGPKDRFYAFPESGDKGINHVEGKLKQKIIEIIDFIDLYEINTYMEWYMLTVFSPCSGEPGWPEDDQMNTCVYSTMKLANHMRKFGLGRLTIGFRKWYIPRENQRTCRHARAHFCQRVAFYRNKYFPELTDRHIRYVLFIGDDDCGDDDAWTPGFNC